MTEPGASGVDFTLPTEHVKVRDRVAAFVRDEVIPREAEMDYGSEIPAGLIRELRDRANQAKKFAKEQGKNRIATYDGQRMAPDELGVVRPERPGA